jgi:hypothetical protein
VQYMLLIYPSADIAAWQALGDDERQAITADYMALREAPGFQAGSQLEGADTATTVRERDGEALITDGPFADTREVLAGYYLFECDDLDQALALARRIPAVRMGGAVEVRPVVPVTAYR